MGIGGAFFHAGIHDSKRLLDGPELRCTVGFFRPDKPYRLHFKDEAPMSKITKAHCKISLNPALPIGQGSNEHL